ncbi:hypothetical protein EBU71_01200 [bacterium]|nr:hypothetical protein [Candidatus Elulimicrobium humile]
MRKKSKKINSRKENEQQNPAKTKRLLKDKHAHLVFKLKMLESWVKESRRTTPENEKRKLQLHNMKHEYKRICKELGIKE